MDFSKLFTNHILLSEKYYTYSLPESKELQMYDFYVLSFLNFALENFPSKNFRDVPEDIVDSVKDATNNLLPSLKKELLNAVFYALCAEFRHVLNSSYATGNINTFLKDNESPLNDKEKQLFKYYIRYIDYRKKDRDTQDIQSLVYDIRKPSSSTRSPETEKNNDESRNLSYKAAHYAIKKTGYSIADMVSLMTKCYYNGLWHSSYGGKAWGNIGKGWMMLNNAGEYVSGKKDNVPLEVAIDHIYDLQHNTDTVFNKLTAYYKDGYRWIKRALDKKANVRSYHELLNNCSGSVKAMAMPVLYNKFGNTWEKHIEETSPKTVILPLKDNLPIQTSPKPDLSGLDDIGKTQNTPENIKLLQRLFKVGETYYYLNGNDNKYEDYTVKGFNIPQEEIILQFKNDNWSLNYSFNEALDHLKNNKWFKKVDGQYVTLTPKRKKTDPKFEVFNNLDIGEVYYFGATKTPYKVMGVDFGKKYLKLKNLDIDNTFDYEFESFLNDLKFGEWSKKEGNNYVKLFPNSDSKSDLNSHNIEIYKQDPNKLLKGMILKFPNSGKYEILRADSQGNVIYVKDLSKGKGKNNKMIWPLEAILKDIEKGDIFIDTPF